MKTTTPPLYAASASSENPPRLDSMTSISALIAVISTLIDDYTSTKEVKQEVGTAALGVI